MCGIFCEVTYSGISKIKDEKLLHQINNRGPDCIHSCNVIVDSNISIFFHGAVLWMQGPAPIRQPVENNLGVFMYNGDIFDEAWDSNISDTQIIMDKLSHANPSDQQIISVIHSLKGPFSVIYYDKSGKNLYFSRDRIGRTTLLCYKDEGSIILASVLDRKHNCVEVPATHLYKLNILTNTLSLYSWVDLEAVEEYQIDDWIEIVQKQQNMPDDEFTFEFHPSINNTHEFQDIVTQIENAALKHTCKLTIMQEILKNNTILSAVKKVTKLLEKSIKMRLEKQPKRCKNCIKESISACNHCTVGVLFSGGLDCTILAFLADKYVSKHQPIDLINVAFKLTENSSFDVPDRITGKQSLDELNQKCSSRQWRFREINISKEKLEHYQANIIGDLVYPRYTILDESLGSAMWFAAMAQDDSSISPCRVLLLGSGADELFGGYVRHRNAFKRHGWTGLSKELLLDWKRISFRNLARDNRVICDHGRQPRMPYLDEDFTDYVLNLEPWMKCCPFENLPCGVGDKLLLRLVALNLGLPEVAILPKRALQFGSRIANKKERGSDISKTFKQLF